VIAGVIDSGIDVDGPEFAGRISSQSADFAGNRGLQDEDGHGTAVSAVLLGAKNDVGTHGVAFNATLLVLRTDSPGSCTSTNPDEGCSHDDNDIAQGVDRAVSAGARVINLSLGGSPANATLRAAIDRATAAGVVLVISAGNDFDTDPINAANPDLFAAIATEAVARGQIIIAGATDANRQIASFSNRAGTGANFYLTALGVRVRAPDQNNTLFQWSGTSFSAPVISGAVALLAQAFPNLTGRQIVDLLLRTADDLGATGTDTTYGRGELNIERAFAPQGQTSLAGTAMPVSLVASGTLSTAMGDAAAKGPQAIVLDSYGRAYGVDFAGSLSAARTTPKLASALEFGTQSMAAGNGATVVALSVARSGATDSLDLTNRDRGQARALAGSVITRLGKDTRLALGIARSSAALIDQMSVDRAGAFLVADGALDGLGFFQRPASAFALRHDLGRTSLTIAAETGDARVWTDAPTVLRRDGYRGYRYTSLRMGGERSFGPLRLNLGATLFDEGETVLGAAPSVWTGDAGARSLFADASGWLSLGARWRVSGAYRRGWTRIGAAGVREAADWLQSDAWSVDLARYGLFDRRDQLVLRVAQPLRIVKGGVDLTLPVGYDYRTGAATFGVQRFSLAPSGRERDVELVYGLPFAAGALTTNVFWRKDPGNVAAVPDDLGAAIRFTLGF
jgi:hypothetical protein